jgi:glycosyltransferase A (GT-A) superfamily protein (DUF2064 family)
VSTRVQPRRAVLLFARAPRLEARLKGLAKAEGLFHFARARIRAAAQACGAELVVVGAGPSALPQRGRNFGERMAAAFADVFALGFDSVAAVGLDAPGLSANELRAAFVALERGDLAFGPTHDGGAYLIGLRGHQQDVLHGVRWQSRHTLSDLRARAGERPVHLLLVLRDLDAPRDLAAARAEAEASWAPLLEACLGRGPSSPHLVELAAGILLPRVPSIRGPPALA